MKKTKSNSRGLEQLNLFTNLKPQIIEFEGREYRKLNLLNSNCLHVDQWVNDAICKGYELEKDGDLRFYASAEERDAELTKTWDILKPQAKNITIANIIFYGLETIWLESAKKAWIGLAED